MTAGLDQFQVAAPDQYAGATPNWKRRMLAAQLLQQQAQTGDKVYGTGLGSMKLLASALGGWMEGKEEKKVADQVAEADRLMPLPSSNGTTAPVKTVPDAPRPAVSTSGGKAVTNYDPKNPPDFLDLIGGAEGTDKGRGYNETLAYGKFAGGPQDLENMPVSQVRQLQAQMLQHPENTFNSSAAGRGQIVGKTLQGLIDQGVVKPDELYNKDVQDRAIDHLARSRGADAAGLRNEWEGLRRVPEDVIVASYNKRYGAKQPTQTAGEVPTDVSSADPNFVPSMQGNKVRPDIAGAMAPMMPPKAEPVPGPSMAPPDLTSVAIDSTTGKRPQAALQSPAEPPVRPPETYPGKPQLAPPGAAPVVPVQPAAQAPPAPQQMAQAQSQPRPQTPAAVSQTPLGATPEEIAFARVIVRNQALGIPVSAIQVKKANDILNPVWEKLNDGTLYQKSTGRFIRAPKQPYTMAEGAQRRGENDEILAQNIPSPEVPMTDEQRKTFKVPEGLAAGIDGRGKIHYGPAGVTMKTEGTIPPGYHAIRDASGNITRLDVIPGSPAATEAKQAEEKAADAERQKKAGATIVTQDIDRALKLVSTADLPTTGGVGNFLSKVPNTAAHDISLLMDTVKTNAGFDRLQAMRNASPTGGALGNVSDTEGRMLRAAIGNLEQSASKDQFIDNMKRVKNIYNDIIHGEGKGPEREKLSFQEAPTGGGPAITPEMARQELERRRSRGSM